MDGKKLHLCRDLWLSCNPCPCRDLDRPNRASWRLPSYPSLARSASVQLPQCSSPPNHSSWAPLYILPLSLSLYPRKSVFIVYRISGNEVLVPEVWQWGFALQEFSKVLWEFEDISLTLAPMYTHVLWSWCIYNTLNRHKHTDLYSLEFMRGTDEAEEIWKFKSMFGATSDHWQVSVQKFPQRRRITFLGSMQDQSRAGRFWVEEYLEEYAPNKFDWRMKLVKKMDARFSLSSVSQGSSPYLLPRNLTFSNQVSASTHWSTSMNIKIYSYLRVETYCRVEWDVVCPSRPSKNVRSHIFLLLSHNLADF